MGRKSSKRLSTSGSSFNPNLTATQSFGKIRGLPKLVWYCWYLLSVGPLITKTGDSQCLLYRFLVKIPLVPDNVHAGRHCCSLHSFTKVDQVVLIFQQKFCKTNWNRTALYVITPWEILSGSTPFNVSTPSSCDQCNERTSLTDLCRSGRDFI